MTLAKVGDFAAKSLFGAAEESGTGSEKSFPETMGEDTGKEAGKRSAKRPAEHLAASPEPAREDDAEGAEHGATATVNGGLVDEYVAQQENHLYREEGQRDRHGFDPQCARALRRSAAPTWRPSTRSCRR